VRRFFNPLNRQKQEFLGFADQIAQYMGGTGIANPEGWCQCRCPAHDDQHASLSLKDTPRGLVLKCFGPCEPHQVRQAIKALLKAGAILPPPVAPELRDSAGVDLLRIAARIWHETTALAGSLGEFYLRHRGITIALPETLRFHPAVYHKESGTYAPAMVAVVQDMHGEACGLHRTWLDPLTAGKAKLDPVRKSLCPLKGHAVHLINADGDILHVAEGIENALSFAQLCVMGGLNPRPVWAALSASGIANLNVPDNFTEVVVIADRDQACITATNTLARRLHRQSVSMQLPSVEPRRFSQSQRQPQDFNDLLMWMVPA
jgi:hypothetical protein